MNILRASSLIIFSINFNIMIHINIDTNLSRSLVFENYTIPK